MKLCRFQIPVDGRHVDLAGASVAQAHRRGLDAILEEVAPDEPVLVAIDFGNVRSATASYLKVMWLSVARAGEQWLRGVSTHADDPLARDVYPVLTGLGAELREELGVLGRAEKACPIEAPSLGKRGPSRIVLLGDLEPSVRETVDALGRYGRASATELHVAHGSKLAATAWNNRLTEVCRLRIATRTKEGRQYVYSLIAPEVSHG